MNHKLLIISAMWHLKINICNNVINTNHFITNSTIRYSVRSDSPFFFRQSVLPLGWNLSLNFLCRIALLKWLSLISWNRQSATIDNYVGTPYSRNDVQPCHFEKKNKFVAVLHHSHDHYSQGFEALSITSCFMFLNLSTYQTPTVESIKIRADMGHTSVIVLGFILTCVILML